MWSITNLVFTIYHLVRNRDSVLKYKRFFLIHDVSATRESRWHVTLIIAKQDLIVIRLDCFLVVVPEIRVLLEPRWLSALGFRQKTLYIFKGFI